MEMRRLGAGHFFTGRGVIFAPRGGAVLLTRRGWGTGVWTKKRPLLLQATPLLKIERCVSVFSSALKQCFMALGRRCTEGWHIGEPLEITTDKGERAKWCIGPFRDTISSQWTRKNTLPKSHLNDQENTFTKPRSDTSQKKKRKQGIRGPPRSFVGGFNKVI